MISIVINAPSGIKIAYAIFNAALRIDTQYNDSGILPEILAENILPTHTNLNMCASFLEKQVVNKPYNCVCRIVWSFIILKIWIHGD